MRQKLQLFTLLAIGAVLMGCSNTAEGVKEDAQQDAKAVQEGAKTASENASEAGRDISAATDLTPAIKTAIVADPSLNDSANQIDVDSTEEKVTLSGHVKTAEMKKIAEDIATRAVKEKNGKQTIENNLVVQGS
ncbi:MAG: BON domain-containing protein [Armatimonadetes bacterium]|nr:BON domain-containing protein [Armatimonadota bacterium]